MQMNMQNFAWIIYISKKREVVFRYRVSEALHNTESLRVSGEETCSLSET